MRDHKTDHNLGQESIRMWFWLQRFELKRSKLPPPPPSKQQCPEITLWRLLDQNHAGQHLRDSMYHIPPFGAHSHTTPQGAKLVV